MSTTDATPNFGSKTVRRRRFWFKFSIGAAVAGVAALAAGADWRANLPPMERVADDKLAVRIQAAIANDPELKPLHLSLLVNVVDRAAVITGPIPELAILPRLEAVVKTVPGLTSTKVSVWVPANGGDPLARRVGEHLKKPVATPSEPPAAAAAAPAPLAIPASVSPPVMRVAPASAPKVEPVVVQHQPGLLEPVAPGTPPARSSGMPTSPPGAAPLPYPTIPPTALPTVPVSPNGLPDSEAPVPPAPVPPLKPILETPRDPLLDAVAKIRRADPNFAELDVELRGRVAVIRGRAPNDEVPWDFAARLRKVDGLERVILGPVRVP